MNQELVSVIIPTYRRCDTLGRAIDSVLQQTYRNVEVIVVDDNNESDTYRAATQQFMNKYANVKNLKYIRHKKNSNGSVARNTGMKYALGEYICFLDDDDEFNLDKIEKQVNHIKNLDSKYGAVYCGFNIVRGNKIISSTKPTKQGNLFRDLMAMEWGTGSGSNVMFRKSVLEELEGFDEILKRHQDWDVLLRMFRKYEIAVIEETLLKIYKDSRINVPNANLFVEVKKYFFSKFIKELDSMDSKDRNKIYQRHSLELCMAFLKNKQYIEAKKCFKASNKYLKVDLKSRIGLFLTIVYTYMPFKELILITFASIIDKFRIVKD